MRFGSLRLWPGEVILVILFLPCLGCWAGPLDLTRQEFAVIAENDLSEAQPRWVWPKGDPSAHRSERSSYVRFLEVSPPQVNGSAEANLLLEFKKGITRDPLNVLSSWNRNNLSSYCSWSGVNCSTPTGPVTALTLSGDQLIGTISPSLCGLQFLSSLDLSDNSFGGPIPTGLANCSSLSSLNLSSNAVSGGIPGELTSLPNLEELDLSANQLTGVLPLSLSNLSALRVLSLEANMILGGLASLDWGEFAQLESLNLSTNQFDGAFPKSLSNCSSLLVMDLSSNLLAESVSDIFGGLPKLQYFDLKLNSLSGAIPQSLGSLKSLTVLDVSTNYLTGSIPGSLVNCSSLTTLFLYGNQLGGEIPPEIGLLSRLQFLDLFSNNLIGSIPPSLLNCSSLTELMLFLNRLVGQIPPEIGLLSQLQHLYLWENNLIGSIPPSLHNCSSLTDLILNSNGLVREIPPEIGLLSQLQFLYLWNNSLSGSIPASLVNCTALTDIVVSNNSLDGAIPDGLGTLRELQYLYLHDNYFRGGVPVSLSSAANLLELELQGNYFTGLVPSQLGLLKSLSRLDLSGNALSGQIPPSLGNATALNFLSLADNAISGQIPPSLGGLVNIQGLYLSNNFLTGAIPAELSKCGLLSVLDLSGNHLTDSVPSELAELGALNQLYLNNNNLTGPISSALRDTSISLIEISLAYNSFSGDLSRYDFESLRNLQLSLDLSHNFISGPLPSGIGALVSSQKINFSFNAFAGTIPTAFSQCIGLQSLDLSSNNLDGEIPESLATLKHLTFFNVSFNDLRGSVPEAGPFANISIGSFLGNPDLCGPMLPHNCSTPCRGIRCHRLSHRLEIIIPSVAASCIVIAAIWLLFTCKTRVQPNARVAAGFRAGFLNESDGVAGRNSLYTKYSEAIVLRTIADPSCENVIGRGARSIVYKGVLPSGEVFAIKWLLSSKADGDHSSTDPKSKSSAELFMEAQMLAKLRHKNILKVLSLYCTPDHKALILEYMCEGSLHKHLHEMEPCLLTWQTRLKIAIGVAHGIKYLHHDFPEALIHRDLKPSNILLDEDFEPKVADFGISKFVSVLKGDGEASASTVCGTVGYMPPEYASQPWVSTKGDVFSYGTIILELLTRRQPCSRTASENRSLELRSWVLDNFEETPFDLLDDFLIADCREDAVAKEQMRLLMRVGILCINVQPVSRPSMNDVVGMLTDIVNIRVEPVIRRTMEELAHS